MGFWVSVLHFIVSLLLNWCMGFWVLGFCSSLHSFIAFKSLVWFGFLFLTSLINCIYMGIWALGFPVLLSSEYMILGKLTFDLSVLHFLLVIWVNEILFFFS